MDIRVEFSPTHFVYKTKKHDIESTSLNKFLYKYTNTRIHSAHTYIYEREETKTNKQPTDPKRFLHINNSRRDRNLEKGTPKKCEAGEIVYERTNKRTKRALKRMR